MACLVGVLAAGAVCAQAEPEGAQFQVNSYTVSYQFWPDVGFDAQGGFVVVWSSDGSEGSDQSSQSIQAQRYAPGGTPLGAQFQVNTYTSSRQEDARVAVSPDGSFVVVWSSYEGWNGGDDSGSSVQARRFAADGSPLGDELQVNSYTTNDQHSPNVSATPDGGFVVAWESAGSPGNDQSLSSIQAQRFDSTGAMVGPQVQVNSYILFSQLFPPGIGVAPSGDFVVVWTSDGSFFSDNDGWSIQGQRYAADGAPLGGEFQVNTYTTYNQFFPDVAVMPDGGFVVVWSGYGSFGDGFSSPQGQRFGPDALPTGPQFQINDSTIGPHVYPRIAVAPDGEAVVVFTANTTQSPDDSDFSIQGKRYRADGQPLGEQFLVNSFTASRQFLPAVGTDPDGNFVVVWQSAGSFGNDSSFTSIQGQRFQDLFADGFETGDTSRWSVEVGIGAATL